MHTYIVDADRHRVDSRIVALGLGEAPLTSSDSWVT